MAQQQLPSLRTLYGADIGIELFFQFPYLNDNEKTFLEADSLAGATSFTASGVNFAANQYIVVGQAGNEKTEILQISGTPTSTSISLISPAVFPHNRGDTIRFIPYNQIEAQFSTDGTNYSVITPVAIRSDATETYMQRSADFSTYSYKFRFYNSTTGLYSAYSSVVLGSGYADNTIWSVKHRALDQLGEKIGGLITDQFLNDSIQEARRSVDQFPSIFRWSFRTKFGIIFGQMLAGQWQITLPTDLRDRNTPKNLLSVRFGSQNRPCTYQDRRQFNQNYLNIVHTTVATAALAGATSLILTSTHDLDSSGAITLSGQTIGQGTFVVSFTGNNKTTNTLTGVTGIPVGGVAVGTDVWQRGIFSGGVPTAYTVDNGTLSFDLPVSTRWDGQDVKGDYYSTIPSITSDSQTFDEPFYDLYVPYLKYKIKFLKSNGKIDRDGDTDWKDWLDGATKLIAQETPSQRVNFVPDVEGFLSSVE